MSCDTCTFWNRGAKPRRTESPEHQSWRPCGNTAPGRRVTGPQEARAGSRVVLTSPETTCTGYHARVAVRA